MAQGTHFFTAGITVTGSLVQNGSGTLTLNGTNTYTGATTINAGTLQIGTGGNTGSISSNSAVTNNGTLAINRSDAITLSNIISGTGNLTKSGAGTLTLNGTNTNTGATTINAGQLTVNGAITSTATVQNCARLTGSGNVGGLIINPGATVNPGNSPGNLTVAGNAVWNAGGNYTWESMAVNTNSGNQTAAGIGWDFMGINGTLTLAGLPSQNQFNLNLIFLSSNDIQGQNVGWDNTVGSTWLIARAEGGIYSNSDLVVMDTNYSNYFNINTAGWTGSLPDGGFQVVTMNSTTDLYLLAIASTAAVPEPGQVAASLLLLAGISGYVWLKRRKKVPLAQAQ